MLTLAIRDLKNAFVLIFPYYSHLGAHEVSDGSKWFYSHIATATSQAAPITPSAGRSLALPSWDRPSSHGEDQLVWQTLLAGGPSAAWVLSAPQANGHSFGEWMPRVCSPARCPTRLTRPAIATYCHCQWRTAKLLTKKQRAAPLLTRDHGARRSSAPPASMGSLSHNGHIRGAAPGGTSLTLSGKACLGSPLLRYRRAGQGRA